MWKYLLAIPLIIHGLANLGGVIAPWTTSLMGFSNLPWIFGGRVKFQSRAGRISSLLWLFSTILLCTAGIGLLLGESWWVTLAIAGAACSLAVILLWWRAVPPGARFGSFFDAVILVALTSPLLEQINKLLA